MCLQEDPSWTLEKEMAKKRGQELPQVGNKEQSGAGATSATSAHLSVIVVFPGEVVLTCLPASCGLCFAATWNGVLACTRVGPSAVATAH
jgi:hypothetical protein